MICASIGQRRHRAMVAAMHAAAEVADLVELRVDYLNRDPDFTLLLEGKPCPVIITCRREEEGGRFKGSEDKRLAILRQAIMAGVDYVDLEMEIAKSIPRYGQTKRIVSYHNFQLTPGDNDLKEAVDEMKGMDPDIVKLVTRAREHLDNLALLDLVGKSSVPTIGFCMGDLGTPSRVLGRKFGAPIAYGSTDRGRETAPGQLTAEELRDVYRYKDIDKDTKLYGLIGDPVGQSLSPAVHNAAFRELGLNCLYVPFRVTENVKKFVKDVAALDLQGYSVTIPHKEAAIATLQQAEGIVQKLRAVNTIVHRDGKATGFNTDWRAAVEVLEDAMGGPTAGGESPLKGRQVLVLGAGGVGRAVAYAIAGRGALMTICNRTEKKAQKLAELLNCRFAPIEMLYDLLPEVMVNCTSVGMYPDVDKCPVVPIFLREKMVVFDTVYNPVETMLVKEGRERGCRVVTGLDMFVKQAALQFKLFTGQDAPVEVMRQAAENHLSLMTRADEDVAYEQAEVEEEEN